MRSLARSLCLLALIALTFSSSSAQVVTGTPPFGSFTGGPDTINLSNVNVHLDVPVFVRTGRGGFNFTYDLSYDSSVWYPVGVSGSQSWQPVGNWGWRGQTEVATGYVSYTATTAPWCFSGGQYWGMQTTYSNWVYHDSFGVAHAFVGYTYIQNGSPALCNPTTGSLTVTTGDGSGWTLGAYGGNLTSITSSSGEVLHPPLNLTSGAASATDRNGNQITVNSSAQFFDTLTSTTPALTIAGSGTPSSPMTFTYAAPGASAHYTINYTNYTIATNFGVGGISEYRSAAAVPLVSSIALPDGRQYTFQYEATPGTCTPYSGTTCTTARLTSVIVPTGGQISYAYAFTGCTSGNNGIFSDGTTSCLKRTTPDGSWTYTRTKGTGVASTTTQTDPQAYVATIQFQGIYETQRVQGSGTTLQTINTCYNGAASPCTGTAITLPITSRSIIGNLPGSTLTSRHVDNWNSYGMPTEADEYDYSTNTYGALLKKTLIAYAALGNNINAFSQTTTVCSPSGSASACGGTGTVIAQTTNSYDQTAVSANTGTTPQHVSVTGSRGNLTTVTNLTSGSNTLSKTFAYYDTGMLKTAVDVNGSSSTVTYNYPDATSTCGNAFPTSITEPLSLSRSMTWNCTGGVATSATDENGKTTTSTYTDPYFWRPASVTDPLTNVTSFAYAPSNPFWITQSLTFNGNQSVANTGMNFDGLGRQIAQNHLQAPGATTWDQVTQSYDSNGRPWKTSMPCVTTGAWTCPITGQTTTYDALNRPLSVTDGGGGTASYTYSQNDVLVTIGPAPTGETTKRHQLEYDALGRLASVCELTSATGSASCGQNTAGTGFLTKYTYDLLGNVTGVTQNAQAAVGSQQTRSYMYDMLSRLTSETNPESGTTTYKYDSVADGTCAATSNGDLIEKQDARGDKPCYGHDALHRLTSVGSQGPEAGVTPDLCYAYDGATVNGVAMTNAKSRLADAYTVAHGAGCGATKITEEGFSYTARGEVSDVYQASPHSGGYYHQAATYYANGEVTQLTGAGGAAASYNLDSEGRIYSTPPSVNALNSTTYNAAGQATQVNLTSLDSDTFTYDSNTGRMAQYKFNVNGQSVIGNLTWNGNGTLAGLAITDPFNAANNQGCGYTHDDLVRVASVNCGPDQHTWNANGGSNIFHQCGRADGDGWSVNVTQDPPGCYMQYGPYYTISATGTYLAQWIAQVDNNSADNNTILHLDVYDDTTQAAIASMDVTREQFVSAFTYQTLALPFTVTSALAGHGFEFRMFWYGTSYVKEQSLDYASNSTWSQTFTYDAFGNISKSGNSSFQPTYNSATNRYASIPGVTVSYDAAGNVVSDGSHGYAWDAYGLPATIDGVGVTYDALGRMVEQNRSGAYSEIAYAPTGTKFETMNGQSYINVFLPLPGGAMAVYSHSLLYFRHPDHLGSSRFASTSGRVMYYDGAYAPFDESYAQTGTSDLSFTSQRQDTSAGLYDFPAREYSIQGRWPSPDPAGLAAVDPSNPQSWNRYAYVLNDPLSLVDLTGMIQDVPPGCTAWYPVAGGPGSINCGMLQPWLIFTDPDWMCRWLHVNCGSSGSGGGGLTKNIKAAVCKAIPEGRTTTLSGGAGAGGAATGSLTLLTNYNTGQVSLFSSGGYTLGPNGLVNGQAQVGFVYNLGKSNQNYSKGFTTANASVGPFGGYVNGASNFPDGFKPTPGGVKEVGASVGGNALLWPITGGTGGTSSKDLADFGPVTSTTLSGPLDWFLTDLRAAICH